MTTGYDEFRNLVRKAELEFHLPEDDAQAVVEWVLRHWEREARDRAIKTVVTAHRDILAAYQTDAGFHNALNAIVGVVVAGVFGRNDLTDQEAAVRIDQLQRVVNGLK